MIKIAFDIDGVVVNFNDSFLFTARKKFGVLKNITRNEVTRYNYWECLDITKEDCFTIVNYVIKNPEECRVKPIIGATKVLTRLSKHTDLIFITARLDKFVEETKRIVYHSLPNITKNKIKIIHSRGRNKHEILKQHGIKYFVDDKLTTCITLKQNDIHPILFTSPWNASNESLFRVKDWNELSNFIFKTVIK